MPQCVKPLSLMVFYIFLIINTSYMQSQTIEKCMLLASSVCVSRA